MVSVLARLTRPDARGVSVVVWGSRLWCGAPPAARPVLGVRAGGQCAVTKSSYVVVHAVH